MIEGSSIRLRTWRDSDLVFLEDVRNNVALQARLLARARGSRDNQIREWLAPYASRPEDMLFIVAACQNDDPLGYLQIDDIDGIDRRAEIGICLAQDAQGHGYGSEAIRLVSSYLQRIWNLRKLTLKVSADNAGALRCYEKTGFQRCGLLKQHVFIEGEWHDLVLMEKFLEAVG